MILTQCSILIIKDRSKKFMNCNTVFKCPFPDWSKCAIAFRIKYCMINITIRHVRKLNTKPGKKGENYGKSFFFFFAIKNYTQQSPRVIE